MKLNLAKSLEMQHQAQKRIPGMTQLLSKRPDMFSLGVWPGYFSKARGAAIWDLDGNEYLDMSIAGIGANVLGYADPDVDTAVKTVIDEGSSCSLNCPEEVELANLLCELHPWAAMVRFSRTGGEAMAIAVRIARAHTGKEKIAFCGYHGWHDWYLAANLGTENALGEHLLSGLSPAGVPKGLTGTMHPFRYNQMDELEKIISEHGGELAAIVLEPIRSIAPEAGFLEGAKALADNSGAVLIFDEISAGFRLCTGGAHLNLGVIPDIAVFSKAMGNGYPISAVIGKADVMQSAQDTFISSTNWTERTGPVAAIATIKKFKAVDAARHLMQLGEMVQKGWTALSVKHGVKIDVSGIPPMSHFSFSANQPQVLKAYFVQRMMEHNILASNLYYAMFSHRVEDVDRYLRAADNVFSEISRFEKERKVADRLSGKPASVGFQRLT